MFATCCMARTLSGWWSVRCWWACTRTWRTFAAGSPPGYTGPPTSRQTIATSTLAQRWAEQLRENDEMQCCGQGCGSGSAWIRINLICWIRIRIRIQIADPDPDLGGQKWPTKIGKSTEFSCFEVLDVLFWGLEASPVAWASFMEA